MKDEIKEIKIPNNILATLGDLTNGALNYYKATETVKVRHNTILDYITNLQEENERLKELCDKYEEEHNTTFKLWKDEIKETPFEDLISIKVLQKMLRLENRIKELERINEEHRKINGELRKTINEAIEYIKSHKEERAYYEPFGTPTGIPNHYEYFVKGYYELLEILQGKSDE